MKSKPPLKSWVKRFQKGPHHQIPPSNFEVPLFSKKTLFESLIQGKPIDLYVYNVDTGDLVFGRANLQGRYPRELAHHIGIFRKYLGIKTQAQEDKFSQGSLDIAIDHAKKEVYFKHLTLGLEDMVFPNEGEWITHIGSLHEIALKALQEIGMPDSYKKNVVKPNEWARIRTGLMQGRNISYLDWKKKLKGN